MRKTRKALFGAALSGILLAAMSMHAFAGQMTETDAKAAAFEHAGVEEVQVVRCEVDTEDEDGKLIYEVEFCTKDGIEYEYGILAKDQTILSVNYDASDAFHADGKKDKAITLKKAKQNAIKEAGVKPPEVTFTKEKTEEEDGRMVHEIKFYTDNAEYEYEFDADTGYLLEWKYQAFQKEGQQASQKPKTLDVKTVKKVALKNAGLKEKDVSWGKIKADYEDGRLVYEGEFYSGGVEYEFEIDGETGAILDWEKD